MSPLKQEVIEEIEYILNGVVSGELEHDQAVFHCGTSHCIAGWHQVLKYKKQGYTYDPEIETFISDLSEIDAFEDDIYELTQQDWGLTENEAYILFNESASIKYQLALLEWFKQGKRVVSDISDVGGNLVYYYGNLGVSVWLKYKSDKTESEKKELESCLEFIEFANKE